MPDANKIQKTSVSQALERDSVKRQQCKWSCSPAAGLVVRTTGQGPGLLWNPPPQAPAVRRGGTLPSPAGCPGQAEHGKSTLDKQARSLLFRETKYTMNLEQHPVPQRPPHALTGTLQPALPSSIHTHSHCVATSASGMHTVTWSTPVGCSQGRGLQRSCT